jgi:dTDP-glucose 4,6-dehydratase
MTEGTPGDTYHISTNRIITVRDLVQLICQKLETSFEANVEIVGERLGKDAAYRLDSSKLRTRLGWKDRISLEEGVNETVAWVDRWLPDLKKLPHDYVHKP